MQPLRTVGAIYAFRVPVRARAMTDTIDRQEITAMYLEDDLSDESLDRTREGNVPFCSVLCSGDKGWLRPGPTGEKP